MMRNAVWEELATKKVEAENRQMIKDEEWLKKVEENREQKRLLKLDKKFCRSKEIRAMWMSELGKFQDMLLPVMDQIAILYKGREAQLVVYLHGEKHRELSRYRGNDMKLRGPKRYVHGLLLEGHMDSVSHDVKWSVPREENKEWKSTPYIDEELIRVVGLMLDEEKGLWYDPTGRGFFDQHPALIFGEIGITFGAVLVWLSNFEHAGLLRIVTRVIAGAAIGLSGLLVFVFLMVLLHDASEVDKGAIKLDDMTQIFRREIT